MVLPAGDEVVQCYVKQPSASVPVPQVRLAAFKRVHVPKGGSVTVSLIVKPDDHSVVSALTPTPPCSVGHRDGDAASRTHQPALLAFDSPKGSCHLEF